MKKAPLTCPFCHEPLDLIAGEYECVQVRAGSCRVMDVRSLRGDTEGTVCFVHPSHLNDFAAMVRMGAYPRGQTSG